MAKIHITLVGGQAAPVYLGIVDANPDKVILVYSNQTEDEANRIYSVINVACELKKFEPVDLNKIEKNISELVKTLKADDFISINIGGGTKPWSILFYEHFKTFDNTTIFYIDQNNVVWDLKTYTHHAVDFDMDVQFRLYGNALTDYKKFTDYTDEDKKCCAEIRKLYGFNSYDFQYVTQKLLLFPRTETQTSEGGSTFNWIERDKKMHFALVNKHGRKMVKTLECPNLSALIYNSGWFEYEMAAILSQWKYAKEIRMNCVFPTSTGSPKNEIDIIINTGTKLLFVECKTKIFNETDIDKFASAVKVYGGLGSKALFVTDVPMSDKAMEKCKDHGVMTFSMETNVFNFPLDKMIFAMLESELFNINAK
ncbi:MAG: DUF1887 family CARF protein [Paludibacter sp.]|nr:DUF1887 family CARF protein [Paludibacter sp.]